MKTFDDLEIRRPELARSYLGLLKAQPGRPIALFAPRRVGKTFVKKVEALGAALEFGEEPKRRPLPSEPALRLDTLVTRLAAARSRPVLLMLDEAQALAESPEGASVMASLRAVLQKRKRDVLAVFTGSSQDALVATMAASGGPMYRFAQLLNFPVLDEDYLNLLAQHFSRVHKGKRLDMAKLQAAFAHLGYKPALMKDLVKELSAEGSTDVEVTLRRMASHTNNVSGWKALLAPLSSLDRHLLVIIAQKKPPIGKNTLKEMARTEGKVPFGSGAGGDYLIEDPLLFDYLLANGPDRLM